MADLRDRVFEGVLELSFEDGGCAAIGEVVVEDDDDGPFVRLQSWEEAFSEESVDRHEWLRSIENKRVRVTVEVL